MSGLMSPYEAITRDPPNVWLTSFYGFDPGTWGFLGFSTDSQRKGFIRRSAPGALVVVYATGKAPAEMLGRVVGLLQCSHQANGAEAYMSPTAWIGKEADPERRGRWNLAVKGVRAWRVAPEFRPFVEEFANETYSIARAQVIGSQGMPLTANEARKLLTLQLVEVPVFGGNEIVDAAVATGGDLFHPSPAGPVSQNPFVVRESEGPKSLYVLKLKGNMSVFLGFDASDNIVVKIGMSSSPATREDDFNRSLPACAFRWSLSHSNALSGCPLFPNSKSAIAGETKIKEILAKGGRSLGGEFFLTSEALLAAAWDAGLEAATKWASLA